MNKIKLGERTNKCRKMRHNCEKDGCFEKIYRCQLGKLDHLFPGMNGMTDIDGYCCINDKKLFIEWKYNGLYLPVKQLEAVISLSHLGLVIIACGDPMEMIPLKFKTISFGEVMEYNDMNSDDVCAEFDRIIKSWSYNNGIS